MSNIHSTRAVHALQLGKVRERLDRHGHADVTIVNSEDAASARDTSRIKDPADGIPVHVDAEMLAIHERLKAGFLSMAHNSSHKMGVFDLRWFGVSHQDIDVVLNATSEVYSNPHVELTIPPRESALTKRSMLSNQGAGATGGGR